MRLVLFSERNMCIEVTLLEVTVSYISVPSNISLLKFALHKVSDKVKHSKCITSRKSAYLKKVHNFK